MTANGRIDKLCEGTWGGKFMTFIRFLATILLGLTMSSTVAAQAKVPPLSAYGQLPDFEDAVLSPSGRRHAMIATIKGTRVLLIIENKQVLRSSALDDRKVSSMEWIDEDRLLVVMRATAKLGVGFTTDKAEIFGAYVYPVSKDEKVKAAFEIEEDIEDIIMGQYGTRQTAVGMVGYFGGIVLNRVTSVSRVYDYEFEHGRPALFALNFDTMKASRVAPSAREGHSSDWLVDSDGKVAATLDFTKKDGAWKIVNADGKTIADGVNPTGSINLVGLGADGTTAIFAREIPDTGEMDWFEVALNGTAAPTQFLDGVSVASLYTDRLTGRYVGYRTEDGTRTMRDPQYNRRVTAIAKAFPGLHMTMQDWTADFSSVLVRTDGNKDSGTWLHVDVNARKADAIGYERLAIGPDDVGLISTFAYKAQDGLDLDGILTLPPGREAKGLPVVMLPHGGPMSHDIEGFDWWAQALASRGYAVFQPNFRGSTNRDAAFERAGYGEWGKKMQTDVSDGLAALAAKGIVDPERACIVGASYGGYAALAGVTLQQGIYRCAVAVAPVTDLMLRTRLTMRERNEWRGGLASRQLEKIMGPPSGYNAVSPYRNAEKADAPILLIHGRDDTVVEYVHSKKMADALKDAGKPYEMVDLSEEDHWLSRGTTRLQMLEATVAFVEKHNPTN